MEHVERAFSGKEEKKNVELNTKPRSQASDRRARIWTTSEVLEGVPTVLNWHCITNAFPWGTRQQVLRIYEGVRTRKGRLMRISTAVTCTHSGTL